MVDLVFESMQIVTVGIGEDYPLSFRVVWAERLYETRFEDESGGGG